METGQLVDGSGMDVVDGPVCTDNMVWWKVQDSRGISGWAYEASTFFTATGCSYALVPTYNSLPLGGGDCHYGSSVPPAGDSSNQPLSTQPVASSGFGLCNNPYWPIEQGAYWELQDTLSGNVDRKTVKSVSPYGYLASFVLNDNGTSSTFICSSDGAIRDQNNTLWLPPLDQMVDNNLYIEPNSRVGYIIHGPFNLDTPLGTLSNCFSNSVYGTDMPTSMDFCYGIGISAHPLDTSELLLSNYYLP